MKTTFSRMFGKLEESISKVWIFVLVFIITFNYIVTTRLIGGGKPGQI
jgi:hypothetical protein